MNKREELHVFVPNNLNFTGQNRTATTGLLVPGSIRAGLFGAEDKKTCFVSINWYMRLRIAIA